MASITHTVGGESNLVSFKSAARVPIESLKVHFSPIQEGEGDPSPENVRPISGWDNCQIYKTGKNIAQVVGYNATNSNNADIHNVLTNSYGTIISTNTYNLPDTSLIITQTEAPNTEIKYSYRNGYFGIMVKNLIYGEYYDISFKVTDIKSNLLNCDLNNIQLLVPNGGGTIASIIKNNTLIFKHVKWTRYTQDSSSSAYNRSNFEIRNCGMSFTLSEFMVTPAGMNDGVFEPYCGEILPITFPVLGKNKFPLTASTTIENIKTGYDNTIVRDVTSTSIYQNVSANNYWIGSTTNSYISSVSNGEITFSSSDGSYGAGMFVPVIPNQTYIISGNSEKVRFRIGYYNDDGTFSGQHFIANKAFTIPAEYHYAFIVIVPLADYYKQEITVSNIQLELGSTATEYEPYDSNHTMYGGYIDLAKGEMVATYFHYILNGTETGWLLDSSGDTSRRTYIDTARFNTVAKAKGKLFSNYCKTSGSSIQQWWGWISSTGTSNSCHILFYIPATIDTVDKWKAYLSENPLEIVYELTEPIHYSLTPNQLTTFLNQNNFWSNTNGPTEVSYAIHDSEQIRSARKRILAAAPKIEEASGSIATFNTDISAPLKECKAYFEPIQDLHGYDKPWIGGSGKNLFNESTVIYGTWTAADGTVSSNTNGCRSSDIAVMPGETYTAFYKGEQPYSESIIELDEDKNFITRTHVGWQGTSNPKILHVTLSENTKYIYLQTYIYGSDVSAMTPEILATYKMQLEKGSVSTDYEPYENICPIEGFKDIEVIGCGKNLFDKNKVESGYISAVTTSTRTLGEIVPSSSWSTSDYILVKPLTIYTLSIPNQGNASVAGLVTYTANQVGKEINGISLDQMKILQNKSYMFTTPSNCKYIRFAMSSDNINSAQFEENSIVSSYESYQNQTIPITFPSEAGTVYGGYVDLVTGEVWQEWVEKDLGLLNYTTSSAQYGSFITSDLAQSNIFTTRNTKANMYIDNITVVDSTTFNSNTNQPGHYAHCGSINNSIYIMSTDFIGMTAEELKTVLSGHKIVYKLATQVLLTILTPTQLKTLRGTNNIWSNANGNIEVKYWTH